MKVNERLFVDRNLCPMQVTFLFISSLKSVLIHRNIVFYSLPHINTLYDPVEIFAKNIKTITMAWLCTTSNVHKAINCYTHFFKANKQTKALFWKGFLSHLYTWFGCVWLLFFFDVNCMGCVTRWINHN